MADDDLPEPQGAPHPIVAYVAQLEDALIHVFEFIPGAADHCADCRRVKQLAYQLIVARAKKLDGRT